jgi:hypothetical protein
MQKGTFASYLRPLFSSLELVYVISRTIHRLISRAIHCQHNPLSLQLLFVIVITPSVSMFIGQGQSLDAHRAAQAERRAANAAVVAAPAAERPSSAAPPPPVPLILSPPGELLTSRGNCWISADNNNVPPPPRSDVSAGGGSPRPTTLRNQAPHLRPGTSPPVRSSRTTALGCNRRTLSHR